MPKSGAVQTIDKVVVFIFGILFLIYPLVFSKETTEAFVLPKQVILAVSVFTSLLLFGARMIAQGKIKIKKTPFDLPLFLFMITALISSFLSQNRADALTSFVPLFIAILSFYLINNFITTAKDLHFVLVCFLIGTALVNAWTILSYLKIYPLALDITRVPNFTPLGALLDQAIYSAFALAVGWHLLNPKNPHMQEKAPIQKVFYPLLSIIILVGLAIAVMQVLSATDPANKLLLLPLGAGFQTGLSTISADSGRLIQSLIFGSGYGTFITDFTKFRPLSINLDPNLWFITFFRSSSFVTEILATMGILGLISYLFLIVRVLKTSGNSKGDGMLISVLLALIISFILPFSFNVQAVLFFILGLYAVHKGLSGSSNFFEIEIDLVALRKGLFEAVSNDSSQARKASKTLPVTFFLIFLAITLGIGFYSARYVMADTLFQKALNAAAANKGVDTYNYEVNAIQLFPYRDGFYRIYSQTNLALANSIAATQAQGSTPNPQTQQTVYTLIQQAISAGRSATTIAPQTYFNWENLASIYRSLIGFGQNADTFALAAEQQAVLLNPNDPQVYINLGGIYYQLGKWDDAQRQFQLAANLKNDYANAHYNLGHTLEQKGDLQGALSEYQTVETLVQASPNNLQKINGEIAAIRTKIGQGQNPPANGQGTQAQQPPLGISKPQTQLPPQHPPVTLPQ